MKVRKFAFAGLIGAALALLFCMAVFVSWAQTTPASANGSTQSTDTKTLDDGEGHVIHVIAAR